MSVPSKARLRTWLELMIDSQRIQGLVWMNDEHTKFKIPWKHHGKQDWSPENSQIFMEWAKHTGKYDESTDQVDYPTWKTRLRCAFNKAPDISEIKDESRLDLAEPFRIYLLTDCKRSKRMSTDSNCSPPRVSSSAEQTLKCQDNLPCTPDIKPFNFNFGHNLSENNSTSDLLPISVIEMDDMNFDMDNYQSEQNSPEQSNRVEEKASAGCYDEEYCSSGAMFFLSDTSTCTKYLSLSAENQEIVCDPQLPQLCDTQQLLPFDYQLELTVEYCSQEVQRRTINNAGHLVYEEQSDQLLDCLPNIFPFTTILPQRIDLPEWNTLGTDDSLQNKGISLLSVGFAKGLLLWTTASHDIHAYRLCPCAVFYKSEVETNNQSVKIRLGKPQHSSDPDDTTIIFSHTDQFAPVLHQYINGRRPRPDPATYLFIGQKGDDQEEILIKITIVSKKALDDLAEADQQIADASVQVQYCTDDIEQNLTDVTSLQIGHLQEEFNYADYESMNKT